MSTTVQISKEIKERLEAEKDHPRETYDEVISELLAEREMRLKKRIEKAKKQKSIPHEKVKEMLDL